MAITKTASSGLLTGSKGNRLSSPVAGTVDSGAWVRPADWLTLPTLTAGQQKFVGLIAIHPGDSNHVALLCQGAYTVDWGDGSAPANFASGVKATKRITYASVAGDCTRGYRQAIVTVTPQAGQNLTKIDLDQRATINVTTTTTWLDIAVVGSSVSTLILSKYNNGMKARMLEQFTYVGSSALTTSATDYMLQDARNLRSIIGTAWTSGIVDFTGLFSGCSALVTIPLLVTTSGTNFSDMFFGCTALQTIPLINTAAGTTFQNMFSGCAALQNVPLLNTAAGTNFANMFFNCAALETIPLINTAAGTNFTNMFSGCSALQSVPLLVTTAGTNFGSMFNACVALQVGVMTGTSKSINYSPCALLSGTQLDAIYTALASGVTAQTITVTAVWGAATDTPSIATAKGWTVTG